MRVVIQRVNHAAVRIDGETVGQIQKGLLLLVGLAEGDGEEQVVKAADKIAKMRIFEDEAGKMNLSLKDVDGELLIISQFTLFASTKKGNRPSYTRSARPEIAIPLYEQFITRLTQDLGQPIQTGEFGAHMQVSLVNDGPVTILIDSKARE